MNHPSLQGQLLIASPALLDPNFARAVVLIVQHDSEHAMGVILNRSSDVTVQEAWQASHPTPCHCSGMLHLGGPCDGPLMAVHGEGGHMSQIEISDDLFFSVEPGSLEWLAEQAQPLTRFFVGYAGWAPGQLEAELETGSWLVFPATHRHVFHIDSPDLWHELMGEITETLEELAADPPPISRRSRVDPTLN